MKTFAFAAALAVILPAAPAFAADPAPAAATAPAAAAPAFTTDGTDIGTLLDNPSTKAVLVKHIAPVVENAQIDMARSMTLKQIQGFAGEFLTDAKLAAIDAELALIRK